MFFAINLHVRPAELSALAAPSARAGFGDRSAPALRTARIDSNYVRNWHTIVGRAGTDKRSRDAIGGEKGRRTQPHASHLKADPRSAFLIEASPSLCGRAPIVS